MITDEDGFEDDEQLKLIANTINLFWKKNQEENVSPSVYKSKTYAHVKEIYPKCTISKYERSIHKYISEESYTEFIKNDVYDRLKLAYIAYPNNVKQFAIMANVTEDMASIYIRYWGPNGNKFSDDILEKFNKYYQSYLDLEIHLTDFSKKVFNIDKCGQLLLLHMKENYLISRYHYQSCKEKSGKRGLEFSITGEYINKIFEAQNRRCAVTNIHLCSFYANRQAGSKFVYSIDRINNNLGYIPGNIRLVTKTANMCRGPYTIEEHNELSILHVCTMIKNNEEAKKICDPDVLEKILLDANKPTTSIIDHTFDTNKEEATSSESTKDIVFERNEDAYISYAE